MQGSKDNQEMTVEAMETEPVSMVTCQRRMLGRVIEVVGEG